MKMQVLKARNWQEYEAEGKTLLAQFGDYDLVRDGTEEVTDAEDYAMARMASRAPDMYQILVKVAFSDSDHAGKAHALLMDIDDV